MNKIKYFISFIYVKGKIQPEQGFENVIHTCSPINSTIDIRSIETFLETHMKVEQVKITNLSILEVEEYDKH